MKKIKTVSLIGLGAVGSANLAKISETVPMEDIRVIASGEREKRYRKHGVTVNGKTYMFPVFGPDDKVAPADLLIFAVKNHHLSRAIEEARPCRRGHDHSSLNGRERRGDRQGLQG